MRMIMEEFRGEIEKYCIENDLSIDKVFSAPRSFNDEYSILQYVGPPKKPVNGMLTIGGPPAPITLMIFLRKNDRLRFWQTKITRKYLGNEGCAEASEMMAEMA